MRAYSLVEIPPTMQQFRLMHKGYMTASLAQLLLEDRENLVKAMLQYLSLSNTPLTLLGVARLFPLFTVLLIFLVALGNDIIRSDSREPFIENALDPQGIVEELG